MEPGEALSAAAQLAVALAGFAGVVVVFRSGALHEWAPIDKLRLRLLLSNSILPFTLCLLAMLLLSIKPVPPWIWRGCSGLALAFLLPFAVITTKGARSLTGNELDLTGSSRFIFYVIGALGTAAMLLQIYNLIVLNVFWAFFATITVQLLAGIFQFVRLILLSSQNKN